MAHRQLLRYLTLASTNYVLSVVVMYVGNELLGYQYIGVRIGTLAVMVAWNFLAYKYWVFQKSNNCIDVPEVS
jgi:putative flippase GtrA